jgi:hypothetical protein
MVAGQDSEQRRRRVASERAKQERAVERERRSAESRPTQARVAQLKAAAANRNAARQAQVRALQTLLTGNLVVTARPNLDALRAVPRVSALVLGTLDRPLASPRWEDTAPAQSGWWRRTFANNAVAREHEDAEAAFQMAKDKYDQSEVLRQQERSRGARGTLRRV